MEVFDQGARFRDLCAFGRLSGEVIDALQGLLVDLPAFGIPKPRYLGIGVKDTVQIEVTFAVSH